MSTTEYQFPPFFTTCGDNLWAGASLRLQDPPHTHLAVVRAEACDEVHIKGGHPVLDQLDDHLLALVEGILQVIIPLEGSSLAQQVAEGLFLYICFLSVSAVQVNCVGFLKVYRQASTVFLFHCCTNSNTLWCWPAWTGQYILEMVY